MVNLSIYGFKNIIKVLHECFFLQRVFLPDSGGKKTQIFVEINVFVCFLFEFEYFYFVNDQDVTFAVLILVNQGFPCMYIVKC